MIHEQVRELLLTQWTSTGGPNEARAAEYYHEDAVLEFPRSGERFRGRPTSRAGGRSTRPGPTSSPAGSVGAATCGWPRQGSATTAMTRSAW